MGQREVNLVRIQHRPRYHGRRCWRGNHRRTRRRRSTTRQSSGRSRRRLVRVRHAHDFARRSHLRQVRTSLLSRRQLRGPTRLVVPYHPQIARPPPTSARTHARLPPLETPAVLCQNHPLRPETTPIFSRTRLPTGSTILQSRKRSLGPGRTIPQSHWGRLPVGKTILQSCRGTLPVGRTIPQSKRGSLPVGRIILQSVQGDCQPEGPFFNQQKGRYQLEEPLLNRARGNSLSEKGFFN